MCMFAFVFFVGVCVSLCLWLCVCDINVHSRTLIVGIQHTALSLVSLYLGPTLGYQLASPARWKSCYDSISYRGQALHIWGTNELAIHTASVCIVDMLHASLTQSCICTTTVRDGFHVVCDICRFVRCTASCTNCVALYHCI